MDVAFGTTHISSVPRSHGLSSYGEFLLKYILLDFGCSILASQNMEQDRSSIGIDHILFMLFQIESIVFYLNELSIDFDDSSAWSQVF